MTCSFSPSRHRAGIASILSLLIVSIASAHQLHVQAKVESSDLVGTVSFLPDHGVSGATVLLIKPTGEIAGETITGPQGRFRFQNVTVGSYTIHARTMDLHEADCQLNLTSSPTSSDSKESPPQHMNVPPVAGGSAEPNHSPVTWVHVLAGIGSVVGSLYLLSFARRWIS